ncbi:MAG TPA: LuxR C-terminal-related transcriptional regulator [Verrucomicrobiae bacterium]
MRQRQVLNSIARGRTYKQIAEKMDVSIHTVRNHVRRIYQKLEVRNSAQAVARCR